MEHEVFRCYYHYYTPSWFFHRLGRFKVMKKYLPYILSVLRKYSRLALSSWFKTYRPRGSANRVGAENQLSINSKISAMKKQKSTFNRLYYRPRIFFSLLYSKLQFLKIYPASHFSVLNCYGIEFYR